MDIGEELRKQFKEAEKIAGVQVNPNYKLIISGDLKQVILMEKDREGYFTKQISYFDIPKNGFNNSFRNKLSNELLLFKICKEKQSALNLAIDCIKDLRISYNQRNRQIWNEYAETVKGHMKELSSRNFSGTIKIDNYLENANSLYGMQPYFFDDTETWWLWDIDRWRIVDEVDMKRILDEQLGFMGQTITAAIRNNHLEAMKWVGREKKPLPAEKHWIQFQDKAFSLTKRVLHQVTPDYFFTNPIPWMIGENDETPTLDELFKSWVGESHIIDLYETIAYCCYRDYPIQVIICLHGGGRNGKSSFLKILAKFLNQDNICSTELDLIIGNSSSRFETSKLYRKLVCLMGETNFGTLSKSSILKKLTGGDMIGFEMKGKKPFDDYNYAKIIIASNSLPTSYDTSDGFYRRWHIIDFPNQFPEGKDIVQTIPEEEYNNLANKITKILPVLLNRGAFTNQGTIQERTKKYMMASNPLPIFLGIACKEEVEGFIRYSELYTAYTKYLKSNNKRIVSKTEFSKIIEEEGFEIRKTSKNIDGNWQSDRWVEGIVFKDKDDVVTDVTVMTYPPLRKNSYIEEYGNRAYPSQKSQTEEKTTLERNFITRDFVIDVISTLASDGKSFPVELIYGKIPSSFHISLDVLIEDMKKKGELFEVKPGMVISNLS